MRSRWNHATGRRPIPIEMTDGSLPMGIVLDLKDGHMEGFPLEKGTFTFTVQAKDSGLNPMIAVKTFQLKALNPLAEITVEPDRIEYFGGEVMTVIDEPVESDRGHPFDNRVYRPGDRGSLLFSECWSGTFSFFSPEISSLSVMMPVGFALEFTLLELPLPETLPFLNGFWWSLLIDDASGTAAGPVSIEPFVLIGRGQATP